MKSLCAIFVVALLSGAALLVHANPLGEQQNKQQLVGAQKCTWGPSYWCSNLTNAKDCKAVRHCIQTVWERHEVAVDNDSICQICKDMVQQARDQLRSNETMDELRQVFEGSCKLIPIKVVKKECCKLADDFIPELVEALSSQMNPDQVCSVAGLCNNAEIDKLLMSYYQSALDGTLKEESSELEYANAAQAKKLSCGNCNQVAGLITSQFHSANRDDILENILRLCGEMSSFSDACANIVLTYYNDIYDHFKQNLEGEGICHLSGVCSARYHKHADDVAEEEPAALDLSTGADIPCELCEQLVRHLRDVLVANTTESEFKQVLEGLCKQTKGFKDECLSIVDQYYDVIYNTLVNDLKENQACALIGVCPKNGQSASTGDIMPLLPVFPPAEIKVTIRRKKLGANEPKFTAEELHSMQLPIDHLMGAANPGLLVENGQLCTLCEYVLHFIQEELATPAEEDEIKRVVNRICDKLPKGVRGECHNFIDMYSDAVIALLIQGLNPRDVCPKMQMCPHNVDDHDDMEVFAPKPIESDETDKPTCPLCLFAIEQAQEKIKNDKSKANIKKVLDHLCVPLPTKLKAECVDFIESYSGELIDMLITDFKPEEICVDLKLCPKSRNYLQDMGITLDDDSELGDDSSEEVDSIAFNEIDTSDELPVEIEFGKDENFGPPPNCLLCEEFIKIAEKRINKSTTKEDIKRALSNACGRLRKSMQMRCHIYVDKYGDKIATLLLKEMEPKTICRELGLCLWSEQEDLEIDEALKYDVIAMPPQNEKATIRQSERMTGLDDMVNVQEPPSCVLCEFVMTKVEMLMENKTEQEHIKHAIESVCNHLPKTIAKSCDKFVDEYANAIISLIGTVPPKEICSKMMLCMSEQISKTVRNEVIECGVCHGATMALLPFFEQRLDKAYIAGKDMIIAGCENLPAKYYDICSEMVSIYGPSILHLAQKKEQNITHICAAIGKCFQNEESSLAYARISA